MKRSSPAADEEEMAVIVPPSPPAGVETMVVDPALEHQRSSPLTRKQPCWRTSTTGAGVGAFIGTLLFLALLVRTEWKHIDVTDVSTVLYVVRTDRSVLRTSNLQLLTVYRYVRISS
jgi:hypothetical protein